MLRLIALTFLSRFGTAALNFFTIVLLSRALGPAGKGEASRMLVVIAGVQMLCDFAGGAALVYLSPRFKLFSLWKPIAVWTFLCSLGLGIWLTFVDEPLLSTYIPATVMLCFINALNSQQMHLLNGREKFRHTAALMLLHAFLTASVLGVLLQFEPEVMDYFIALFVSWGASFLASLWFLRQTAIGEGERSVFRLRRDGRLLFASGSINQAGHLLQFLNQRLFFLLLPAFALGIYSNAVALAESIWMIASSIAMIQYGKIANMHNKAEAAQLTVRLFRLALWVSFPAVVVVALLPEGLYLFIFGDGFRHVDQSLRLLLPGVLTLSGYLVLGHYFSGTGQFLKNNLSIALGVAAAAAGFALMMLLRGTPPGPLSAALITSLANSATFFSVIWLFLRDTRLPPSVLIPRRSDLQELRTLLNLKKA